MKHRSLLITRALSLCVTFVLVCTAVLTVPIQSAYADRVTVFDADFDNASIGALSDTLAVDVGAVVPEEGNVSIIGLRSGDDDDDDLTTADDDDDNGDSSDRALAVDGTDGQATALLQWSNYPDSLPISTTEEIELRVRGNFFALSDDVGGTSFGLFSGESFFEFFSFGSNGQLTRNGESLGLSYRGSSDDDDDDDDSVAISDDDDDDDNGNGDDLKVSLVRLDVRLVLNNGDNRAEMIIITTDGRRELNIALDAAFTLETLNQFRFQAPAGSAAAAVTDLNVRLSTDDDDDDDDDDPPAVIIVRDTDIVQEVVIINNQVFVNVNITIVNTGGKARGSFLVFNLRDDDDDDDDDDLEDFFDLADVVFIEGVGFVSSIENGQVRIGLGQNNIISSNGTVQVQLQFKLKDTIRIDDDDDDDDDNGGSARISVDVDFNLFFDDTGGGQSIALPPIVVVVPDDVVGQLPDDDDDDDNDDDFGVTIVRLPIESIDTRLRSTWDARGGLDIFGFPVTEAVLLESGITVQYFERARIEYHPDLAGTEFEVLIGLLGVELGYRVPPSVLNVDDLDDDDALWYYPETGHVIGESFRSYWLDRGGLALFGYPISAVVVENGREVQYFERSRMELWPENSGTPYEIQLGFLGLLSLEADDDD
ncbi:MAG: hypothetical protein AAGF95_08680 [Chloroflexota bacterium]